MREKGFEVHNWEKLFQFQNGTIMRKQSKLITDQLGEFQFQNGTIMSLHLRGKY